MLHRRIKRLNNLTIWIYKYSAYGVTKSRDDGNYRRPIYIWIWELNNSHYNYPTTAKIKAIIWDHCQPAGESLQSLYFSPPSHLNPMYRTRSIFMDIMSLLINILSPNKINLWKFTQCHHRKSIYRFPKSLNIDLVDV